MQYKRTIVGVGYDSGGIFKKCVNGLKHESYKAWHSMLRRCYSGENESYKDCSVREDWHDFQAFASWFSDNYYKGYHLDKDWLKPDNKIYSPDVCIYVPQHINKFLCARKAFRGSKKQGLNKQKNGTYTVRLSEFGQVKCYGTYKTQAEAFEVYKRLKEEHCKALAEYYKDHIDKRLYTTMMEWVLTDDTV